MEPSDITKYFKGADVSNTSTSSDDCNPASRLRLTSTATKDEEVLALIKSHMAASATSETSNYEDQRHQEDDKVYINTDTERDSPVLLQPSNQQENEMETNQSPNPEAVGLPTVISMFDTIKQHFATLTEEFQQVKSEVSQMKCANAEEVSALVLDKCKEDISEAINLCQEESNNDIAKLKSDLKHFKFRNRALTNVVDCLATKVSDLKHRMENMEISATRNAITLSRLRIPSTKKDGARFIEQFLQNQLNVEVGVEDYFRLGENEPKLTVIFLQNSRQKADVLTNKVYLKGVKNEGRQMYINDYTPTATLEKKKREQEIFTVNQQLNNPATVEYSRGKLTIAGELYSQKVVPPSPKQIVDHDAQTIQAILKLQLEKGGKLEQDRSVFTGYTACTNTHTEIRHLYTKMRLLEPTARHIACAYWIDGNPVYSQDYCDDGEPGAGRTLLTLLHDQKMKNRVIFVARHYGGVRMGSSRFDCYKEAGKMALSALPWNRILNINQKVMSTQQITENQPVMQQKENGEQEYKKRAPSSPVPRGRLRCGRSAHATSKRQERGQYRPRATGDQSRYRGARPKHGHNPPPNFNNYSNHLPANQQNPHLHRQPMRGADELLLQ